MNNEKHTNWENGGHPSDDELLCFIDGEESHKETAAVQFHLKACWSCRVRAEKLNEVISNFVEFRTQIIKPAIKIPDNRGNFKMRLNKVVSETKGKASLLDRWRMQWLRFFAVINQQTKILVGSVFVKLNGISRFPLFNFLNDERTQRLLVSFGATVLLFSVLLTYLFWIPAINPVSAEELLQRTSAARETKIRSKELPVVYQQVQIKHRTAAGNNSLKAELWQDETYSRLRRTISENNKVGSGNSETKENLLSGLEEILRASNFVPAQPFSVAGFRAWRNSLTEKNETVKADKTTDGTSVLRLSTESANVVGVGKLLATTLTVRSSDYHPLEQHFVVETSDGTEEYSVQEISFAVLSLSSLSPDFFGDKPETTLVTQSSPKPEIVAPSPNVSPSESPAYQLNANKTGADLPNLNAVVASPELEVEVLELLHQAGADLGEQITVVREPNGPVKINGIVETAERKNQLLNALRSISNNRAVQVNIQTVEEAIAAQQKKKSDNQTSPPIIQMETHKIEGLSFPAESQVREYFAKQGKGDEAVKQYAMQMVNRSEQAMRFLYALKRLKDQMSPGEFEKLTPAARTKWLTLVKTHARSYKQEINVLRRELQPVFGSSGITGEGININSDADLFSAIERLFIVGAASNKVISGALTTGRGSTGGNALQSADFWRNLSSAEAIAERLQNVK